MAETRRKFIKDSGIAIVGFGAAGAFGGYVARLLAREIKAERSPSAKSAKRWALAIDTKKCASKKGCTACVDSCHVTHNVPTKITNPRHEVKWLWKEDHEHVFPMQKNDYLSDELRHRKTLVLCNHCERPPCVRVCPTQATWRRPEDGIVMMDMHRCIGCRYCIAACPYGSRSFNWMDPRPHIPEESREYPSRCKGVVEKCNLCAERLAKGQLPACVEACNKDGAKAMVFGDIADPSSEIARVVRDAHTMRRKLMLGTEPHVFYQV